MIQDITERKKAEEAQKVLEDSFTFGFKTSGIFQIISTLGFRLWKISAGRLQRTRRTHRSD